MEVSTMKSIADMVVGDRVVFKTKNAPVEVITIKRNPARRSVYIRFTQREYNQMCDWDKEFQVVVGNI
ncbi:MAG: hypothetical protein ABWY25_10785 [Paenisporosarcina sp.]